MQPKDRPMKMKRAPIVKTSWQKPDNSESWLRKWLIARASQVTWIEAALGGTVGAPDALVHLSAGDLCGHQKVGGLLLPLELKRAESARIKGALRFRCKIRPPQRLWHDQCHVSGIRTAYLVTTTIQTESVVFMFPGKWGEALGSTGGAPFSAALRLSDRHRDFAMSLTANDFWL